MRNKTGMEYQKNRAGLGFLGVGSAPPARQLAGVGESCGVSSRCPNVGSYWCHSGLPLQGDDHCGVVVNFAFTFYIPCLAQHWCKLIYELCIELKHNKQPQFSG